MAGELYARIKRASSNSTVAEHMTVRAYETGANEGEGRNENSS
jgi:hypothetical protein